MFNTGPACFLFPRNRPVFFCDADILVLAEQSGQLGQFICVPSALADEAIIIM